MEKILSPTDDNNKNVDCSSDWGIYKNNVSKENNNLCINQLILSKVIKEVYICYQICSFYIFYDQSQNKYICTENENCPNGFNISNDNNECVKIDEISKESTYNIETYDIKTSKIETKNVKTSNIDTYNIKNEEGISTIIKSNFINNNSETQNKIRPNCTKSAPFLLIDSMQCVDWCSIRQREQKNCIINYNDNSKEENEKSPFDIALEQIRQEFKLNYGNIPEGGITIFEEGGNITIIKSDKQQGNIIDFGKCGERLKSDYGIGKNESFYLIKFYSKQIGMRVDAVDYEVWYPVNGINMTKLDLKKCEGLKIEIINYINLTGDINEYKPKSDYYNDVCSIKDSNDTVDISIPDRRENFVDNNMSVCEPTCDFISYNAEDQKAVCSCDVKTVIPLLNNIKFDKKVVLSMFKDFNNIANVKILACFFKIAKIKYLIKNLGFYTYGIIILMNFIFFIIFISKQYKNLKMSIKKLKRELTQEKLITMNNLTNLTQTNQKSSNKKQLNNTFQNSSIKSSQRNIIERKNIAKPKSLFAKKENNKIKGSKGVLKNKRKFPGLKIENKKEIMTNLKNVSQSTKSRFNNNINNNSNININFNKKDESNNNKKDKNNKNNTQKGKLNKVNLNISELNDLEYKLAIIKDKRTCSEIYISFLRTDHIFLTLFYLADYNAQVIKISMFVFNLGSLIAVNALFFSDSTMNKIYRDNGSFNFVYQLPQTIYSSLISGVLTAIINFLGLSEGNILELKNCKPKNINKTEEDIINKLKIKFVFFYIIKLILLLTFWYYVICFCGVYKNTQMHLIKDSLMSFVTNLITPIFTFIFPAIFRICGLKNKSKCGYTFSKILKLF